MDATTVTKTATRTTAAISAAFDLIRSGLLDVENGINKISEGVKSVMDKHGSSTMETLQGEFPGVPSSFWSSIISVATGRLYSGVVATGCAGLKYLTKLTISDQKRAINEGVPVAVPNTEDFRLVPAYLLTKGEICRAITPSGSLRTLAEQAAFDRQEREATAERIRKFHDSIKNEPADLPDENADEVRWRVEGSRVKILSCPLFLTKNDLKNIMRSL